MDLWGVSSVFIPAHKDAKIKRDSWYKLLRIKKLTVVYMILNLRYRWIHLIIVMQQVTCDDYGRTFGDVGECAKWSKSKRDDLK